MMRRIYSHCEFHLGDHLNWLHALRRFAKEKPNRPFWHFASAEFLTQLSPVVEDIGNIELFSYDSVQWKQNAHSSINVWKNFNKYWEKHPLRWDWSGFTIAHHNHIAQRLGLKTRFRNPEELLFDYPALNPNGVTPGLWAYDFMVQNTEPGSGQFKPMAEHGSGYMDHLIRLLSRKYKVITTNPIEGVECTRDTKQNLTDIGRLSMLCRHHIMVASGPMWATFNTTNNHCRDGRIRIALLDNGERLNMPGIQQLENVDQVESMFRDLRIL